MTAPPGQWAWADPSASSADFSPPHPLRSASGLGPGPLAVHPTETCRGGGVDAGWKTRMEPETLVALVT
jgi:hypothetical protein